SPDAVTLAMSLSRALAVAVTPSLSMTLAEAVSFRMPIATALVALAGVARLATMRAARLRARLARPTDAGNGVLERFQLLLGSAQLRPGRLCLGRMREA